MREEREDFSTLFYYLPFITDRKEDINHHRNNVNLLLIDCSISFIESFSKKKKKNLIRCFSIQPIRT